MKIQETMQATLDGKLDSDGGGKQPDRRSAARSDGKFAYALLMTTTLEQALGNYGRANSDDILTEEDQMVVAFMTSRLIELAAALNSRNPGGVLAIRGNQSHRWDRK